MDTCEPFTAGQDTKVTITIGFLTDVSLLIIMLIGLFRLDCHRHSALSTGRFLWNQVDRVDPHFPSP